MVPGQRESTEDMRLEIEKAVEIKRSLPLTKGATRFEGPRVITEGEVSNHLGIYEGYDVGERLRVHSSLVWYDDWLIRLEWVCSSEEPESREILWKIIESLQRVPLNGGTPKE